MSIEVRYRGNPSSASLLADQLREVGLDVDHELIIEQSPESKASIDIVLYVNGPTGKAQRATGRASVRRKVDNVVAAFLEQQTAKITITEIDDAKHSPLSA